MHLSRPGLLVALVLALLLSASCQKVVQDPSAEILQVMQQAQDNWNAGDLEAYMQCYWRSPELRFAGRDEVSFGWEPVLNKYQAGYPDRAAMGQLLFSDLRVDVLDEDDALVFGRWLLKRENDRPHGLFTLHFRRFADGWKIVSDHTSSGDPADSAGAASITSADLLAKVLELTDPACGGRLPGTGGYDLAARRMAARFEELGLEPGGDDGFFQHLPIETNRIGPLCQFQYENADHQLIEATLDRDFLFRGFTGSGDLTAEVVFCGYGLSLPERGYDDYADMDVRGKVVLVFKQPPGWRLEDPDDPGWGSAHYPRPKARTALDHGAVAVLMVSRPNDTRPQPLISSVMHGPGEQVEIPQLQISHTVANTLLAHTGMQLTDLQSRIDENHQPYSRELGQRVKVKVQAHHEKAADTMNVVAVLPGTDPVLKDEHLIVGAHLDHVGSQAGAVVFAGANDNASGAAAVVEMAEAFVHGGVKPRRSVVFVLFTGEEQGLIGSRYHADNPALPLDKAVAMINLDCVAHGDSIQIWGGKTSPRLWEMARAIDAEGDRLLALRTGRGGGADAAPFHQAGLPTLYFASKYSYTHLHRSSDTLETLNGDMYQALTRVAFRTAEAVAAGDYEREELKP